MIAVVNYVTSYVLCDACIGHSGLHCGCSNSHFLWCLWLEAEGNDILKAHSCLILVKWFPGICEWEVKIEYQTLSQGYDKTHFCQVWTSLPVTGFTQCHWSFQAPSSSECSQQIFASNIWSFNSVFCTESILWDHFECLLQCCYLRTSQYWWDSSWAFCDSLCTVMCPINKTNTWHNSLQDHLISV